MTISPFATQQTDVFVPALGALAIATLFAVLPVVFAPTLGRRRGGRAVAVVSLVVGAALLVVTAVEMGAGFRAIADERARVGAEITREYGLHLTAGQVGDLVDGGALQLPGGRGAVRFARTSRSANDYRLVSGKGAAARPLPLQA